MKFERTHYVSPAPPQCYGKNESFNFVSLFQLNSNYQIVSHQSRDSGLNQIRMAIQAHNNKSNRPVPVPLQPSQSSNTIPSSMKPNVPRMGISKTHRFIDEHRFSSYPGNYKQTAPKVETVERLKVMNGSGGSNASSRKSSNVSGISDAKPPSNGLSTSLPKSRLADVKPRYLEPKKVHMVPPEITKVGNKSNTSSRTASPSVARNRKMVESKTSQDSNISLDSLSSPHRKKSSIISSKNTSKESLTTFYHHIKGQKENIDKNVKAPLSARSARSRIGSGSSTQSASHSSSLTAANRTVRNLKSKSTDTSPGNAPKSFFTQRSRNILMKREQKVTPAAPIQLPTSARERNKLRAQLGVATVPLPTTTMTKSNPLRKSGSAVNPSNRSKSSTGAGNSKPDLTKVKNEKNIAKKRQEPVAAAPIQDTIVYESGDDITYSTTSRLERSSTFCKESSDITDLVTIE